MTKWIGAVDLKTLYVEIFWVKAVRAYQYQTSLQNAEALLSTQQKALVLSTKLY